MWFDDVPVIGELPPEEAVLRLRQIGEDEVAEALEASQEVAAHAFGPDHQWRKLVDKPWLHTSHAFGYLPPAQDGGGTDVLIQSAENILAEPALKQTRVKVTLDRLRVASYPGRGIHHILVHFFAQNQIPEKTEDLHFSATYRVLHGQQAAVRGYPVFVGLQVGNEGICLRVRTINVKNDQDEALLSILESPAFQNGLHLITMAQPAIVPLSELARGFTEMVLTRHRNISVQDINLGLDFGAIRMHPRLAEGSYLAVQIPEGLGPVWNWEEWIYHPASGLVVKQDDPHQTIPYNYLVFSISRYQGS